MSITSRSPTRVAGAVLNSGSVNTGEQQMTFGGAQLASFYLAQNSGSVIVAAGSVIAGDNVLLFSGAGRLKDVFILGNMSATSGVGIQSGPTTQITFYDSPFVASGRGVVATSGHKIIGSVPVSSGFAAPTFYSFDTPFQSGLAVVFLSGAPPFSVSYTPEANPSLTNPG